VQIEFFLNFSEMQPSFNIVKWSTVVKFASLWFLYQTEGPSKEHLGREDLN
jgi:hypothetical protein